MQRSSKKLPLFKDQIIKKSFAGFLMVVFVFSITPTILLHNWVANHSDTVKKSTATKQPQVSKKLFNCHCDNIVAESPFTELYKISIAPVAPFFSLVENNRPVLFPEPACIFHSLRGPPMV